MRLGAYVNWRHSERSNNTQNPTLTGGTITIDGRTGTGSQADSVTIDGAGSGIFTQSTGSRPGGDINIPTSQSVALTRLGMSDARMEPFKGMVNCGPPPSTRLRDITRHLRGGGEEGESEVP